METSKVGHAIKNRKVAQDVFITPTLLALHHLKFSLGEDIDDDLYKETNDIVNVLDPCCYNIDGSYVKHLRELNFNVDYCEITMGKDFFNYQGRKDGLDTYAIIGNPPYSILDRWLLQSVAIAPQIISYLIGQGNLTAKRIEFMNKNGYSLKKVKMLKVFKFYGMSYIVHFEKQPIINNCIEIEDVRKVWR